jgi:hypothetical protein
MIVQPCSGGLKLDGDASKKFDWPGPETERFSACGIVATEEDGRGWLPRSSASPAVLRDKAASPRERLEALKFVVHFVADIHQPLHCADDGDRGGNAIHVIFVGHRTNLHAVWDILDDPLRLRLPEDSCLKVAIPRAGSDWLISFHEL